MHASFLPEIYLSIYLSISRARAALRLGALRSRPKRSAALRHFMKTSHPLPQPRASAAICRRIWSREHRASCGERMRCPSRPRARLSASSATSRSTVDGPRRARALKRGAQLG